MPAVLCRGAAGRRPGGPAVAGSRPYSGRVDYSRASTTTDLAGSVIVSVSPASFAPSNFVGLTTSGDSKVLCESIAGAVSTRPDTPLAVTPASVAVTVMAVFGFVFAREIWICPALSLEADAL